MSSNNKTIAKNTILLYVRTIISTIVSLYTSRVVLRVLGVEDYGTYAVVAGVISMFSFLNAAMAGATSRFLIFGMGKTSSGDIESFKKLKDTFSTSLIIHIGIALVILFLAETLGLWFLYNKLVIPPGRMYAANFVYQFSVISMFITVTQVPYNAVMVAHEKFDMCAYLDLLKVFLKLAIVYLLLAFSFDKLILYSFLVLSVSFIIAMLYRLYCIRNFEESKFKWVWDKNILLPMLKFSGWDLFGNLSLSVNSQGSQFTINMLLGVAINAACNIAITVQGTIQGFAYNVVAAFRPQIVKKYAEDNIQEMISLIHNATRISLSLLLVLSIPCYWEAHYVLELWLGDVPDHTVVFLKITLISLFFQMSHIILNISIVATGIVKNISLTSSIIYCFAPFVLYLFIKNGVNVDYAYYITTLTYFALMLASMFIVKKLIPAFSVNKYVLSTLIPFLPIIVSLSLIVILIQNCIQESFWRVAIVIVVSVVIIGLVLWLAFLNQSQRKYLINYVMTKVNLKRG